MTTRLLFAAVLAIAIAFAGCTGTTGPTSTTTTSITTTTTTPSASTSTTSTTTTTPSTQPTPIPVTQGAVAIADFAFQPQTLEVTRGANVTWTNDDSSTHTATSDTAGVFNSGNIFQDRTYSFVFQTSGTYDYHCDIHFSMKGHIIVS